MSQAKPNSPLCWFCEARPPDKDSASKWDMYKETREKEEELVSIVATSWETASVPVPRCAECKRAHDVREGYVERGWKIGLLLGVAATVVLYLAGLFIIPTIGALIFRPRWGFVIIPVVAFSFAIAGGIIAWLVGKSAIPQGVKDQSAAVLHPNVKGMEASGWKIGTKPVRV